MSARDEYRDALALGLAGDSMTDDYVLAWHYGPTADDPEPEKMWHYGCGREVMFFDGYAVCRCGAQACCDLHGRHCEQGGEECCERCTEAHHFEIGHGGVPCSSPDLSRQERSDG